MENATEDMDPQSQQSPNEENKLPSFDLLEQGIAAKRNGDSNLAQKYFYQALAFDLAFVPALVELAILFDDTGELDKALEYYDRALQIDPDHYELRLHYANALIRNDQIDQGISHIRRAIELKEDSSDAWYYLALTYFFYLNETQKAIAICYSILEREDDYVAAYNLLGEIAFAQSQLQEAKDHFETALQADPDNKDAHLALSAIYGNDLQKRHKSLEHSFYLLEKDPADPLARHNAQMALKLPPHEQSSPSDTALEEGMAYIYLEDWALAEHALKRALRLNPSHPHVWQMLQQVRKKKA